ncbi:hypothetical protein FJZ36_03635 [Candidatus Poribacteria bacterium]|nr:hypothetical protein [Candidatus Poribacteria bacterium]
MPVIRLVQRNHRQPTTKPAEPAKAETKIEKRAQAASTKKAGATTAGRNAKTRSWQSASTQAKPQQIASPTGKADALF